MLAFFTKSSNLACVIFKFDVTKTTFRTYSSHSADFSMHFMKLDEFPNIYIRKTVAVSEKKIIFSDIWLNFFNASTCQSIVACIDDSNFPIFRKIAVNVDFILALEIESDVAVVKNIISEVIFYDMLFISSANYEILITKVSILFHNMPNDWMPSDFDHRFRNDLRFFTDSSTKTAG